MTQKSFLDTTGFDPSAGTDHAIDTRSRAKSIYSRTMLEHTRQQLDSATNSIAFRDGCAASAKPQQSSVAGVSATASTAGR